MKPSTAPVPSMQTGLRAGGSNRRPPRRFRPLLLSVALLASCGKSVDPPNNPTVTKGGASSTGGESSAAAPGGATPQEAFNKAKEATARKEFGALYDIVCPPDRDLLVFYTRSLGGWPAARDPEKKVEFEALLKKYNVPEMIPDARLGMMDREPLLKVLAEMFREVRDKRGFCTETLAFVDRNGPPGDGKLFAVEGTLKDLKEIGDTATATAVESEKHRTPLAFQKIEGRWFLNLPVK